MSKQGKGQEAQPFPGTLKVAFEKFTGRGVRGSLELGRFDRFTKRARKALALAQEEARRLNHNYIGTEHLLLGLAREGEGVAAQALGNLGVELDRVRNEVASIIGHGDHMPVGEMCLTPRAKKVLELAVDEARRLKHRYIGTEHLLLGLIREGEGIAARVLHSCGITLEQARGQVLAILADLGQLAESTGPKSNVVACRLDDRDLDAIDALVEAGIRTTRSDAAAWLIRAGIEAHQPLFDRVYATVDEIRRLRVEAQAIAHQVAASEDALAQSEPEEALASDAAPFDEDEDQPRKPAESAD